jgi:uncharacterized protein involved in outer membrane biogenesis
MADRVVSIRGGARWLWLLLAVAVLVVAIVVIAAQVDDTALRERLERRVSDALGVDLRIEGSVEFGLWPAPRVTAGSARLEHGDVHLAEIDRVSLHLAIAPLFTGRLLVRRLVLDGADIHIVRDASGRYNFGAPDREQAQLELPPDVAFADTAIRYLDESSGATFQASDCEGRVSRLAALAGEGAWPLARLEADGEVRCGTLRRPDFALQDLEIEGHAREGRLVLDPVSLVLFGGQGRGRLEADFSIGMPTWSLDFAVDGFELDAALQALEREARAEGLLMLSTELSANGEDWEAVVGSLEGSLSLHGRELTLHGTDLDDRLSDYDSTRRFGLLDVGAVLLAGPVGLVATKGRDFARLLSAADGQTEFREVSSTWTIRNGVAEAKDVAAATTKNRLAARGKVDFSASRFDDLTIMLLDRNGCAVMEQAVTGPFSDPEIAEPGVIETMLGPWIELLQRGLEQFTGEECEVVYEGAIEHP